ASIAHDYIGVSLSDTGDVVLDWCALVYTTIPLALLLGVLRTRLALLGHLLVRLSGEQPSPRRIPELPELTPRELEVLALIAEGRTDRGIAKELYVTPKTVEAHIRSIFRKLDLPSDATENKRVHAVLTFLRAAR